MHLQRTLERGYGLDTSGSRTFRRRRFAHFLALVDEVLETKTECRVIDIGGEPAYWVAVADLIGERRLHVTLLNQDVFTVDGRWMASVLGDARDMHEFPANSFDVVHSNSVIEHVGRWRDMVAMAREVQRVAPRYFVQTPYFWFPIEPHCSTAFFHWVPESIRLRMLMRRPRGTWGKARDVDTAMLQIQSNTLLDRRMLQTLFPGSEIVRERFFGLTKSLISIGRPNHSGVMSSSDARDTEVTSQDVRDDAELSFCDAAFRTIK